MRRRTVTIESFAFTTREGGTVYVDVASALAAPVDEEIDGIMLQIPVFCDGRAGYIYATPTEIANVGRTLLFDEATTWARKSAPKKEGK